MERCDGCGKTGCLFEAVPDELGTLCSHCYGEMKVAINEDIAALEGQAGSLPERLIASIEATLDEMEDLATALFHIFEDKDHDIECLAPFTSKMRALTTQFNIQVDVAREHYLEDIEMPRLEQVSAEFHAKLKEIKSFFGI